MNLKKVVLVGFLGSAILGATTVVKAAPQDEILGSTNGLGGTSHGYIKLTPWTDVNKVDTKIDTI